VFMSQRPQGCDGSNPFLGTKRKDVEVQRLFCFILILSYPT
jgi:hypothetical protein